MRVTNRAIIIKMIISDLDPDDFSDDEIANDLRGHSCHYELLAVRIAGHSLQISGSHDQKSARRQNRKDSQNSSSHAAMGADGLHMPSKTEPLANDLCQAAQNLTEVSARLPLQQYGRGKESHIQQRRPPRQIGKRRVQPGAQILFIEQCAELLAKRVG